MPGPDELLRPETLAALRAALEEQRSAGSGPTPGLSEAIRTASREARERQLRPEALIIQLKALADDVGLPPSSPEGPWQRQVREWMVTACLRAYWSNT